MGVKQSLSSISEFYIEPAQTALVIVDMNYVDAHRDYGVAHVKGGGWF